MFRLLTSSLVIFSAAWSVGASAQEFTAKASPHNVFLDLSVNRGGLGVGAGYEYMLDPAAGLAIGGQVRGFSKDAHSRANGLMILGATGGFHFFKKAWDLAFTPSVNLISIDSYQQTPGDATTLGPGLGISLTTQLTERFAIGFAFNNYYVWFNNDYRGILINDLALRGRFSF